MPLHIIKLCVGVETVEELDQWYREEVLVHAARGEGYERIHVTRMFPKRVDEILDGGSLYWVIKGVILCRQRLIRLEERRGDDGILRCALVMDRQVIRTEAAPRRPFQGWRYMQGKDAPRDLAKARGGDDSIPVELARALAEIGLR